MKFIMEYKVKEIKKGIKLHLIRNEKFKTNLVSVFLTTDLNRENITKNSLIPAVLRRGSKNMPTQEDISTKLEEMYGASFNCGIDKRGDNQVLKFYIEAINSKFLPQDAENILDETIANLLEIVFNPLIEDNAFLKTYVEQEKVNVAQLIDGKMDNKARYAVDRCIEEMYRNKPYSLYKYGYKADSDNIDEKSLYKYYKELLNTSKIDIFVSGIIDEQISDRICKMPEIQNLNDRNAIFNMSNLQENINNNEQIINEAMDVTQGKLVLGLNLDTKDENMQYVALVYNEILGGSANSRLFQNVREKASLAYVASSSYVKIKNNIIINCGIEIKNYDKTLKLVREQLEELKNGNFSENDIDTAKKCLVSNIKIIDDEQDTEIMYFYGQEFYKTKLDINQYIEKIQSVTKQDVLNIAQNIKIDTIYFLNDKK